MRREARAILALALALAPPAALAGAGSVDLRARVVHCTGTGAPRLRDAAGNVMVARLGAERAAKRDARRSCLEALRAVRLPTGATLGSALAADDALAASVKALVKRAKVAGAPRYFSDGGVELDLEVPLDDALSALLSPAAKAPPDGAPR